MFRTASILWCIALLTAGAAVEAEEKAKPTALQQFESLKKLAGDWVEVGKDGKPTEKVVSSIRVTSAGSAIEETLFPGGDHEMVTMYFLDGDRLLLTHYCAGQPAATASRARQGCQADRFQVHRRYQFEKLRRTPHARSDADLVRRRPLPVGVDLE